MTSPQTHATTAQPTTRGYLLHLSIYIVTGALLLLAIRSFHNQRTAVGLGSANSEHVNQIEK